MAESHSRRAPLWQEQELQTIRGHYPSKGSKAVGAMLGRTSKAVRKQAGLMGVRCEVTADLKAKTTRETSNTADIHYFEKWSPGMAWLLGYIWADGCIDTKMRGVTFSCTIDDRELLDHVKRELKATQRICICPAKRIAGTGSIQGRPYVRLAIMRRYLAESLGSLHGIHPNKSYLDNPFPLIPDEHLGHFARGNLDGDGTISYSKSQGMSSGRVSFLGNKTWLIGFQRQVSILLNLKERTVYRCHSGGTLHHVCWGGKEDMAALRTWLYPPGKYPFLARKRNLFQQIVRYQRDHVISRRELAWTTEEDQLIRDVYPTKGSRPVMEATGRSSGSVRWRAIFLCVRFAGGKEKYNKDS